jgi:hypothetical protein
MVEETLQAGVEPEDRLARLSRWATATLLMAWVLAVWLPGRTLDRGPRLLLGALLSFIGFLFARVCLMASGFGSTDAILTDIVQYISKYGDGLQYFGFPLLFSVPVMASAATLLYFGGRAVRFRRSRSAVILGCVGALLGFLLWIGAVSWDLLAVEMLWTI